MNTIKALKRDCEKRLRQVRKEYVEETRDHTQYSVARVWALVAEQETLERMLKRLSKPKRKTAP